MKILLAHNYYQQPGGEDVVFAAEKELLRARGHTVLEYVRNNDEIRGTVKKITTSGAALWSQETYHSLQKFIQTTRPDIAHFHNTFPLISPSAYYACRAAEIPVVQTLHNPRLICPAATFFRRERLCQDCLGRTPPWPAVLHGCYHHSRSQTMIIVTMLTIHRWLKTWQKLVDVYLVTTQFYRQKFIEGNLPAEKIVVKPHFILSDPGNMNDGHLGEYALFIGRLDPEKGVRTLINAWKSLNIPLKIRGDGQLEKEVREFIRDNDLNARVELIGRLSLDDLHLLRKRARFFVWPSEGYYETFGMAAVESFSVGVPVIASRIGVMNEIVVEGRTGLHFEPGNPQDLAEKVRWAWDHPEEMARMGRAAHDEYQQKYTSEQNYRQLMGIYQRVISSFQGCNK